MGFSVIHDGSAVVDGLKRAVVNDESGEVVGWGLSNPKARRAALLLNNKDLTKPERTPPNDP